MFNVTPIPLLQQEQEEEGGHNFFLSFSLSLFTIHSPFFQSFLYTRTWDTFLTGSSPAHCGSSCQVIHQKEQEGKRKGRRRGTNVSEKRKPLDPLWWTHEPGRGQNRPRDHSQKDEDQRKRRKQQEAKQEETHSRKKESVSCSCFSGSNLCANLSSGSFFLFLSLSSFIFARKCRYICVSGVFLFSSLFDSLRERDGEAMNYLFPWDFLILDFLLLVCMRSKEVGTWLEAYPCSASVWIKRRETMIEKKKKKKKRRDENHGKHDDDQRKRGLRS